MIEFQQKYIEDAGELIAKLETDLINFENDTENEELIQELFRVMHTLKGSSSMFGFNRIGEFTHLLEDIYDLIRNKQLSVNIEILNLTFQSIDFLKLLLYSKETLTEEQENEFEEIIKSAQKYSTKKTLNEIITSKYKNIDIFLLRIVIKPLPKILLRGINPDNIFEELTALGKNINFEFSETAYEIFDEDIFNKYWEIFIDGNVSIESINNVFIFLDNSEYSIDKLTDFSEKALENFLLNSEAIEKKISLSDLKTQVKELVSETKNKQIEITEISEKTTKQVISNLSEDSIRVPATKLDYLLNLVSELIIVHAQFENHSERLGDEKLLATVKELSKISRNFRDEILSTRLIPVAVLATGMQRLVRDLSLKMGKEIELITEGLQTELDKNIISRIESPIMHIIRNCIDHGLEMPEERIKNNKKEKGIIRFIAFYAGSSVFIQVQDDGKGIDTKYVFDKAVSKGIIKYDTELTNKQIYEFLFLPGFSTVSEITEISGRGVGLDVVKKNITELHGEINVDSEIGLGTSFTLKLPLTLSIVDALYVTVGKFKILVSTGNVLMCKYLPSDYFIGKDLNYKFDNKCAPVVRLSDLFVREKTENEFEVLIIFTIYGKFYGVLVDRIVNSIQAVIKPLGHLHANHSMFIGASQLGDGTMAYVLDTNFLLNI